MSLHKLEAIRHFKTYNIGDWLSAKIYADARANQCSCGGKFNGKQSIEDVEFPVCSSCGKTPSKYRIRAQVVDEYGKAAYRDIRHDSMGRRLVKARTCLDLIDRVKDDIEAGKFDVRNYESAKNKDKYLFESFVNSRAQFSESGAIVSGEMGFIQAYERKLARGEISQYTMDAVNKYTRMLLPFFGKIDIAKISKPIIETYRDSYTEKFSNRDLSLGWLKTILNSALEKDKIKTVPKFEVKGTNKRTDVPNLITTREKVLPAIKDWAKREAIRMLDDYGTRPCEVRAIQMEQLSDFNKRIKIDRHFSKRTMTEGRKSLKKGQKMAILDRPWTPELEQYIEWRKSNWDGNPKAYLFTTSTGTALGPGDLSEAWREAENKVGVKHSQMYGIRGAKITEILETKGVTKAKNFAGHTSAVMTLSRYDHSSSNVDDLIKEAN